MFFGIPNDLLQITALSNRQGRRSQIRLGSEDHGEAVQRLEQGSGDDDIPGRRAPGFFDFPAFDAQAIFRRGRLAAFPACARS